MKKSILFLVLVALGSGSQSLFANGGGTGAPDGGSTMLMLGAGVAGMGWVCRRFRR
ncbi:MAG TPA: hypothetical protein VH595_07850 [Verrucomicrobiae bacterium]|nr:hypothetical protein [Verrucomicrobiae bacterium]